MNDSDILEFVTSLPNIANLTPKDRYDDFRTIFGTEQGQRVLAEIVGWGHLFRTPNLGRPVDPNLNLIKTGEMNIVRRLLWTYSVEPQELPEKTTSNRQKRKP